MDELCRRAASGTLQFSKELPTNRPPPVRRKASPGASRDEEPGSQWGRLASRFIRLVIPKSIGLPSTTTTAASSAALQ